ncbi:MAG: hypothetical protein AAFX06_21570 [Planctomycetota bacterium]
MNLRQIELEKAFHRDFCEWEPTITATISNSLDAQMDAMQDLIRATNCIQSINIAVPDDFISDETEQALQKQCRYDVSYISVFSNFFVFYLEGKWDGHIQAEYSMI